MFDLKKKLRKNVPLSTKSTMRGSDIKPLSKVSNQVVIPQKNTSETTDEIEKTAEIIHNDVASAVSTLRRWLNQDKLH